MRLLCILLLFQQNMVKHTFKVKLDIILILKYTTFQATVRYLCMGTRSSHYQSLTMQVELLTVCLCRCRCNASYVMLSKMKLKAVWLFTFHFQDTRATPSLQQRCTETLVKVTNKQIATCIKKQHCITIIIIVVVGTHLRDFTLSMTAGGMNEPFQRRTCVWQLSKIPH